MFIIPKGCIPQEHPTMQKIVPKSDFSPATESLENAHSKKNEISLSVTSCYT
jgi:hypothetical protein